VTLIDHDPHAAKVELANGKFAPAASIPTAKAIVTESTPPTADTNTDEEGASGRPLVFKPASWFSIE
jgi:hypothetical protein